MKTYRIAVFSGHWFESWHEEVFDTREEAETVAAGLYLEPDSTERANYRVAEITAPLIEAMSIH